MLNPEKCFTSALICLFAVSVLVGCGGGEEESSRSSSPSSTSSSSDADSDGAEPESTKSESTKTEPAETTEPEAGGSGLGSITGSIKVTGEIPTLDPLVKEGDQSAKDAEVCAAEAVPDQSLVVGEGNGLANVFVYMRKAPDGAPEAAPPEEPVVFDQKGCQFVPHALIVQTSQSVKAVSSDGVPHNIHTYPIKNSAVNQIIQPNDKEGLMIDYNSPEIIPVKVGCDIHPWMLAWHFPIDHPYAAVTDANGNFKIDNLPAGTHELRIWHEKAGYLERSLEVTVKAGEPAEVSLEYGIDKFTEE